MKLRCNHLDNWALVTYLRPIFVCTRPPSVDVKGWNPVLELGGGKENVA